MTSDPRIEAVLRTVEGLYPELGEALFKSDVAKILAAADTAAWRPISEAPKDGTEILTWGTLHEDQMFETHHLQVSWWDERGAWNSHLWGSHAPTHFRYIEPPQEDKE